MNSDIKKRLKHIKNRYTYEQLDQINQKHLNYFLRKKYRYEKLDMKEKAEECDAYISLYHGSFLDFIDYINKKRKKEFEKIAYLILLIKQKKESLIKSNEKSLLLKLQSKNLFDLTEKEANLLGGKILKEYERYQIIMSIFLSKYIDDAQIVECETLRDLANICQNYIKKAK